MKIKAAVLHALGTAQPYSETKPLTIEEVELAPPGPGEVLVEVKAAGLCHSDLSVINGSRPRPMPMVIGHEAAGVVAECGPGVNDLKAGDKVVMVFVPSCGSCLPCAEGRPALCEPGAETNTAGTLLSGERRLERTSAPTDPLLHHHMGVSAFAEFAVVSRRSLIKIDDEELSHEEAALFGCAVLTGVGAVVNTAQVPPGSSVAVLGLGGVGLNALLGAKLSGARHIIALDLQESKLALASELGATGTVNAADPNAIEAVKDMTGGGVDFAFELAGSVKAMEQAYRITKRGGTTVSAGLPHPDHRWELQHVNMVAEERTIKGSYIGSCVPMRDIPRYIELYRRGQLPVDRLMSDVIALEEINSGFDRLAAGKTVRQVIRF